MSLGASSSAVSIRADEPGTRLSFARKRQQELGPEVPASKLWGDKGLAPWGVESGCCAPLGNLELRQLRGVPSLRFTSCCYKCCCCHYWLLLAAVFSEIEIGRIRNRILCRSRYFFTIITFEYWSMCTIYALTLLDNITTFHESWSLFGEVKNAEWACKNRNMKINLDSSIFWKMKKTFVKALKFFTMYYIFITSYFDGNIPFDYVSIN